MGEFAELGPAALFWVAVAFGVVLVGAGAVVAWFERRLR